MKLKVCSIYIFLSLISLSSIAQYSIRGVIVDRNSNEKMQAVEVYNSTIKEIAISDKNGFFAFYGLEKEVHSLIVFKSGFSVKELTIDLSKDTLLTIEMEVLNTELSEVVVSEKKDEIFSIERLDPVEGTAIYAGKKSEVVKLNNFVGNSASNNPRQIYSQVVGLNIYEGNDAGLQLNVGGRGLDPNRTSNFNTRQNGYDISADVLGYPESYYTPTADALREIRIVRGAASLQYGTQFGGMINFKIKEPNLNKKLEFISRNTLGSFELFNTFNSISGKTGKFSYYSFVNYKQGAGFRPNSDFQSFNAFSSLNYDFSDKTSLNLEITYLNYLAQQAGGLTDSQFEENIKFSNRERNWFAVDWQLYSLMLKHKLTYRTNISLNIFGLHAKRNALGFRGDPQRPERNPITEVDDPALPRDLIKGEFNNWGAEFRSITRYKPFNKEAVFLIGVKYYQSNNTSRQGPGNNGSDADFDFAFDKYPSYPNQSDFRFPNFNLALFGEHILNLSSKFSITPGFRIEHIKTQSIGDYLNINYDIAGNEIFRERRTDNRTFERNIALFGLGLSFYQSSSMEVYGNISQNYRSVTFSDIRVVNPTFIISPDISDERGYTSDLGIRGTWGPYLSYDVGAFSMIYNDRIGTILVESGPNKGDRVRQNIGDAWIYGAEIFADWNALKTFGFKADQFRMNPFVNLAITNSEYIYSDENNVSGKQVEFIPLINLKTGLRIKYRKLSTNLQFTYLSEQFTDAENTETASEGDSREGIIGTIPEYYVADLSLAYNLKKFSFETGVNNILNNKYFTRRASGYPGPGIIPADGRSFYLTIGLKI